MAAPYAPAAPVPPVNNMPPPQHAMAGAAPAGGAGMPQPPWQPEIRSVTPATNNLRSAAGGPAAPAAMNTRYASAPRMGGIRNDPYMQHSLQNQTQQRSMTPNRLAVGNPYDYGAAAAPANPNTMYNTNNNPQRPPPMGVDPGVDFHSAAAQSSGVLSPANASNVTSGGGNGPTSTGLIRLSLKKPMGIVFEPMYDPHQPSAQRGVRICDLPRTGAAALSRKLQVGDELLQINDKTVSRLTFDEIMDYIIDADPDSVNLLFRRPRKETLQQRNGVPQKLQAASNNGQTSKIKWQMDNEVSGGGADGGEGNGSTSDVGNTSSKNDAPSSPEKKSKSSRGESAKEKNTKKKKDRKRAKKGSVSEEEETLQSGDQDSYVPKRGRHNKNKRNKKHPYETESFLDLLIDTICSNPNNVCRDGLGNPKDDDYISEDEESFGSHSKDESTYVTYEESVEDTKVKEKNDKKNKFKNKQQKQQLDRFDEEEEEEEEDDDEEEEEEEEESTPIPVRRESSKRKDSNTPSNKSSSLHHDRFDNKPERKNSSNSKNKQFVETVDEEESEASDDRAKDPMLNMKKHMGIESTPLGLSGAGSPSNHHNLPPNPDPIQNNHQRDEDDETNPNAPIREVEYDERIDHGADVSVMESLGGPSLLIEKQRAAQMPVIAAAKVPPEILQEYGLDYPTEFGKTREETVAADPLRFYTYVVKSLLEQHEPEKVRLLDKLLAKYKGREDHLVQKLSVRYNRPQETANNNNNAVTEEQQQQEAFSDAVKKNKQSPLAAAAVHTARERMQDPPEEEQAEADNGGFIATWPDKEEKQDDDDHHHHHMSGSNEQQHNDSAPHEETSETGSEYSRDSVDGTSPAVIAQVSELLNYVYGKTSVPGQIDRVSTIMRAYEGREAVLLELLETKALIKANKEKENADELPAFLRNSPQMQKSLEDDEEEDGPEDDHVEEEEEVVAPTPMSSAQVPSQTLINDDISSMSGVSSPADQAAQHVAHNAFAMPPMTEDDEPEPFFTPKSTPRLHKESSPRSDPFNTSLTPSKQHNAKNGINASANFPPVTPTPDKKKKKGIFGGLFSGKKKGKHQDGLAPSRSGSRQKGLNGSHKKPLRDGSI